MELSSLAVKINKTQSAQQRAQIYVTNNMAAPMDLNVLKDEGIFPTASALQAARRQCKISKSSFSSKLPQKTGIEITSTIVTNLPSRVSGD